MILFALSRLAFAADVSITSADDITAAAETLSPGDTLVFTPPAITPLMVQNGP